MATKKANQPKNDAEYLSELRAKREEIESQLSIAKTELFKLTPTAKLGNSTFENWRRKCTDLTKDFLKLQGEIEKVEKIVGR